MAVNGRPDAQDIVLLVSFSPGVLELVSAAPALMVFISGFRHSFLLTGDLLDP